MCDSLPLYWLSSRSFNNTTVKWTGKVGTRTLLKLTLIIDFLVCVEIAKLFFLLRERKGNSLLEGNTTILGFFCFSGKDTKQLSPPVPPLLPPSPIPLFNPREVQLGKKDVLSPEENNSFSKQNVNPYRKRANGMD